MQLAHQCLMSNNHLLLKIKKKAELCLHKSLEKVFFFKFPDANSNSRIHVS